MALKRDSRRYSKADDSEDTLLSSENPIPTLSRNNRICTVNIDESMMGIGEGRSLDMIQQCAPMLIGEDRSRNDLPWHLLFRGWFDPPGRLQDIKRKVCVPLYEPQGSLAREHIECYSSGKWQGAAQEYAQDGRGIKCRTERASQFLSRLAAGSRAVSATKDTLKAAMEADFRADETAFDGTKDQRSSRLHSQSEINQQVKKCGQTRDVLGRTSESLMRLCTRLEPVAPYDVEDPLHSENRALLNELRNHVMVPIAVREQCGDRCHANRASWNARKTVAASSSPSKQRRSSLPDWRPASATFALVEQNTSGQSELPNAGGETESMKIGALCDTHFNWVDYVSEGTDFLGSADAQARRVPRPARMEWGGSLPDHIPYLAQPVSFHNSRLWPLDEPGYW
jgi:L-alanine-DL-glutamate epimerase-like enolase superfamily enzyme